MGIFNDLFQSTSRMLQRLDKGYLLRRKTYTTVTHHKEERKHVTELRVVPHIHYQPCLGLKYTTENSTTQVGVTPTQAYFSLSFGDA